MKLSVVIPVYNEARTVGEVIERVAAVPFDKEIIAVDDGSTDTTGEELQLHTSSLKQIHSSRVNFGAPGASNGRVGGCGRSGFFCAGGCLSALNAETEKA